MNRARIAASAHARTGRRVHAAARVPRRVPAQLPPTKDDGRDGECPCAYIFYTLKVWWHAATLFVFILSFVLQYMVSNGYTVYDEAGGL